jgi:hypothetical protein
MAGSSVVLQPRDRRLLSALEVLSCLNREQAQVLGPFTSVTRANARLLQLTRARILRRTFHGTIAGGRQAVYVRRGRRRRALRAIEHELALSEVFCRFSTRPSLIPETRFHRFVRTDEPLSGSGIIPDGLVEITHGGQIHPVYVEVDRGTEPMSVIDRKASGYLALAISAEASGQPQFRVVVVTTGERRLKNLCREVARRTTKLFFLTTLQAINREGPWAPVWRRPTGEAACPLFPSRCDTAGAVGD